MWQIDVTAAAELRKQFPTGGTVQIFLFAQVEVVPDANAARTKDASIVYRLSDKGGRAVSFGAQEPSTSGKGSPCLLCRGSLLYSHNPQRPPNNVRHSFGDIHPRNVRLCAIEGAEEGGLSISFRLPHTMVSRPRETRRKPALTATHGPRTQLT